MPSTTRHQAGIFGKVASMPGLRLARPAASLSLAAAWYSIVVLPEAQTMLHRQWHRTDVPAHVPNRAIPFVTAIFYAASLPLAVTLRAAGAAGASRLAMSALVLNPPTLLLASVIASEIMGRTAKFVRGAFGTLWRTVRREPQAKQDSRSEK
jgi:hypothetical protein